MYLCQNNAEIHKPSNYTTLNGVQKKQIHSPHFPIDVRATRLSAMTASPCAAAICTLKSSWPRSRMSMRSISCSCSNFRLSAGRKENFTFIDCHFRKPSASPEPLSRDPRSIFGRLSVCLRPINIKGRIRTGTDLWLCTHGDFKVLSQWETRPPASWPDIPLSHTILTLSQPVLALC